MYLNESESGIIQFKLDRGQIKMKSNILLIVCILVTMSAGAERTINAQEAEIIEEVHQYDNRDGRVMLFQPFFAYQQQEIKRKKIQSVRPSPSANRRTQITATQVIQPVQRPCPYIHYSPYSYYYSSW